MNRASRRRGRRELSRVTALICAVTVLCAFVDHPGPYPVTMFFPPAGALFGYLVLRGPIGVPAGVTALLVGNAVTLPRELTAQPLAAVALAVTLPLALALASYPLHRVWRRHRRGSGPAVFGLLALFVLSGLLLAPILTAAGSYAVAHLLGDQLRLVDLARQVLGTTTAIASVGPAALVLAVLVTGATPARLRAPLDGRREALVPAAVIVLAPVLALALPGAGLDELWLLPFAAVPLIWIAATGDLLHSAVVLSVSALVVGMLARGLFGESGELYRAQAMVLGCSLATLYVAAACITEAGARAEEAAARNRWDALVAAAPAVVTRVNADGSWPSEDETEGERSSEPTARMLPAREHAEVRAAIRDRHPRTLRWRTGTGGQRSFVTQVTPLPDGETLVVTTETALADPAATASVADAPGPHSPLGQRHQAGARIVLPDGPPGLGTALIDDVGAAIERSELELVYQPDVHPERGTLLGVEALVRWHRRDGLSVSTADFIRMAEETGAVSTIDDWVIRASLAQLGRWRRELAIDDVELGINVSALSLTADLPERLATECRLNDVPPGLIRLEVTQTALGDASQAIEVLHQARALGFRIALDGFGTGYASLSRLRTLPVDVIKIDRSFLASIAEDPASATLVGMILGLAEPLRLDVMVEGVETRAQRDVLVELGCRRAQGFFFSPPAAAEVIHRFLRAEHPIPTTR